MYKVSYMINLGINRMIDILNNRAAVLLEGNASFST